MATHKGQVKFFNSADNKRFGFIRVEDGREIFFHLNDFRPPVMRDDGGIDFERLGAAKQMPKVGDSVVFVPTEGNKGWKASPWTYAEDYEKVEAKGKQLVAANSVIYRVVQRYDVCGKKGEDEVKFEGNVRDLNRKFPKPRDRRLDDLASGFSCSDFDRFIRIERKDGENWVSCDDPRTALGDYEYRRAKRGY